MRLEIVVTILMIIEFLRFILEAGVYSKKYLEKPPEMSEEARRMFN
jgi:hypothetical protein